MCTCIAGFIKRRLMKAMESLMIAYDGTVRNSHGDIIQLLYGEDGVAGQHTEKQNMLTIQASNAILNKKFYYDISDDRFVKSQVKI